MSYVRGYIQGERSFDETVQTCCQYPARERIEASVQLLDAADRFKNMYNRRIDADERME